MVGEAGIVAGCAVVYGIACQPSLTNQRLVISKSSITFPRLKLVSAHMASNLIENVKAALKRCNIRSITG